jgi:hypothetical protein
MRTTILAFLGAAFLIYWLLMDDPFRGRNLFLGPVKPNLAQIPNPPYDLEEPSGVGRSPASADAGLKSWVAHEATKMGQPDPNPEETKDRLAQKALSIKRLELRTLKLIALDRSKISDERFLSIYILGLSNDEKALDLLREISLTQLPGTGSDRQHSDEVVFRAHALEALVQKLDSEHARSFLREMLARSSDPVLARHAQYWLRRLS